MGTAGPDRGCPAGALDPQVTTVVEVRTVTETQVPGSALATLDARSVKLAANRSRISVLVTCPSQAAAACAGRLSARTRVARRTVRLGAADVRVAQGTSRTLTLRVPSAGRRAVAKVRRLRLTLLLTSATSVSATR